MTGAVEFDYQGRACQLRYVGGGQFSVYLDGEHIDLFDATDTLRDLAVEALNTDA